MADDPPPYDYDHDPAFDPVEIPPELDRPRDSLVRWVSGCVALTALAVALAIGNWSLIQARNDANRQVDKLSAEIDCRANLSRRELKARDKVIESIGIIVGDAIVSPPRTAATPEEAAARQAHLEAQGPLLESWAKEMNAALDQIDHTDELCRKR